MTKATQQNTQNTGKVVSNHTLKEAFQDTLNTIKGGIGMIKKSERLENILLAGAKYAGIAYRATKGFVQKHWKGFIKNSLIATGTMVVAGLSVSGVLNTVLLSTALYTGVKSFSEYMKLKDENDELTNSQIIKSVFFSSLKNSVAGFIYSYGFYCTVFYGGFYAINAGVDVLNFLLKTWYNLSLLIIL